MAERSFCTSSLSVTAIDGPPSDDSEILLILRISDRLATSLRARGHHPSDGDLQLDAAELGALSEPLASARRSGKANVKVLPTPSSLSTQIRPPCSSTSFLVSASPSPVPSALADPCPTWRNS